MSTLRGKSKLIKESPFARLTARTEEVGSEDLKEARQIDIAKIVRNPRNPRRTFDEAALEELAQDIALRGILQPLIVRPIGEGESYEIVVGERRYQAALRVNLEKLPVIVRELDDKEAEEISLVENIQRENLSLGDEANFFKLLQNKYGYSIREIASEVAHKSHSYVEARLILADYPALLQLVEVKQLGLQKAVELARSGDKKELQRVISQQDNLLETSQSVILKDSSLETSQLQEKKTVERPKTLQPVSRYVEYTQNLKVTFRRLEKVKEDDKEALLALVHDLENQLTKFKAELGRK